MKSLSAQGIAALLSLVVLTSVAAAQKKPVTLEQASGRGVQYYAPPERARWAEDGTHYIIKRDGVPMRIHPATNHAEPAPETPDQPGRPGRRRRGPGGGALQVMNGDLYFFPTVPASDAAAGGDTTSDRRSHGVRLTTDGASKRIVQLSDDKAWASFVRDSNLSVINTTTKGEWKVTTDGDDNLLYGILDWVYQEEIYGRGDFQGHWWNGSSKCVAFLRLDESEVRTFTLIDHVPDRDLNKERVVKPEVSNYPKAGDPNPKVQLQIAWPESKKIVDVDLSKYDSDVLIVRVGWTPDHAKLWFMVQDRIQTWLELNTADPATGAITTVVREESDTWVNRLPFPRPLDDGTFLWFSERTGYQHIYHYDADWKLLRAVTGGEWQVRRIVRVAEIEGATWIWFTGTKDGAIDDNLYRVRLDGENLTRLTYGDGRHSVSLNGDGSYFLDTVSSVSTPAEVRLCKGDGSGFEVLSRSTPRDVEKYVFCPTERLTINARDGYPLDATLIVPPDFDPAAKYPIYLPTYSGPDAPTVRNAFRPSTWHQLIAQHGALVLQVNVRSASGRGQAHTGQAYKQLGVPELRDLEDAVDYVVAERGGDPERVAIEGWSYGGFMAAYALTHSKKFSLGLAGGGVHDWRLYDTIYTERYMSTPQRNPEGYAATSVIEGAKNLHGHLVLMHGAMDDNVHVQNTMHLVDALQRAGADDFEMMLYPKARHGVRSPHRRKLMWRMLQEHLGLKG